MSLSVPSRRRKTTWRQWLTCQDMQVEEPLLITADAAAPSMLQVRCQATVNIVSLIYRRELAVMFNGSSCMHNQAQHLMHECIGARSTML